VAVAAIASGSLAGGTYLAASHHWLSAFVDRAERQARINLALTTEASPSRLSSLLDVYRQLGGVETVAVTPDGEILSSLPSLHLADVPANLRKRVTGNHLVSANISLRGTSYLILAGRPGDASAQLYFFFSRDQMLGSLRTMRDALLIGWMAIAVLAALVGHRIARAALLPVRATADAAQSIAEGLLATRLPVGTDDEFGALTSHFNRMAEALEEKISALAEARDREKRFTVNAAHELRTPLAGMSAAASLLEEDLPTLPGRARRPAELLVHDVRRLRRLVLGLLELGQLDSGQDDVVAEPVQLDEFVRALIGAGHRDADVELELEPVEILSDRWRLERILTNLISNAVTHGRREVRVRVRKVGDRAVVEVADNGPGIAEEHLSHIFDRFYKASPPGSAGSGLGLAIAREYAATLAADLEARSRLGHGACFTLSLPLAGDGKAEREEDETPFARRPPPYAAGAATIVTGS
jgi:two-component system sensor histidine kinase MtrB